MMQFSANLGFLWTELPLPEAIQAAANAGFDAVELHWPYDTPADQVKAALEKTSLPLLGLNTRRGDVAAGDNGLAAIPGREAEARNAIDEALSYARATGAQNIHVMAGNADGAAALDTFLDNLRYALSARGPEGPNLLIEPLNRNDAPAYFLRTTDQAREIIEAIASPHLRLMFDCYHVGRTEGDLLTRFDALREIIGHVQFAAVPDRGAPDHGEINYSFVLPALVERGWQSPMGAEYKPGGPTGSSLDWRTQFEGR